MKLLVATSNAGKLVEIREILPPKEIQDAMTRQMAAERSRRRRLAAGIAQ